MRELRAHGKLACVLPEGTVFRCEEELFPALNLQAKRIHIKASVFEPAAEALKGYLLKIEGERSSSYDNSDDERASCSESRYGFVKYAKIDAYSDKDALLWQDGKIRGVAFTVRSGSSERVRRFFFDGSVCESMSLGYSASHSSRYTYVERVSLVKKGENGAPEEGGYVNFNPSETSPDL